MRQLASRLMGAAAPCPSLAWLHDVAAHLERVLNTGQGSALSAPTYGMSGGVERMRHLLEQLPTSAPALEQVVIQALATHDRRLGAWRSRQPPRWGKAGFTLYLAGDTQGVQPRVEVALVVHLVPSGHVQVRPA